MIARYGAIVISRWEDLDGYAVSHGMPDLRDLPLERFCSYVWYMLTRNAEKEADVQRMRAQLWRPPPNSTAPIPRKSPWSAENEQAAFGAFAASIGSKKATAGSSIKAAEEDAAARRPAPPQQLAPPQPPVPQGQRTPPTPRSR